MIKINLLPQRKPKRQAEPGQRDIALGMLGLLAAAAAAFMFLHKPATDDLEKLRAGNTDTETALRRRRAKINDLNDLRTAVAQAREKTASIEKLMSARAVPAHMLHELGEILTPGRLPTMTTAMAKDVASPTKDTYRLREDWDPKHVWISDLTERQGVFTLVGGAESDGDVTQLSKRMQASAYFQDVTPRGGEKITDKESGVTYYRFTITGKVVY